MAQGLGASALPVPGCGPTEKGLMRVPSALKGRARVQVVGWQLKVGAAASCGCHVK